MESTARVDARRLLTDNRAIRTRAVIMGMQIDEAVKGLDEDDAEAIAGMALARAPMTGMPMAHSGGSTVEYIADKYEKRRNKQSAETRAWIQEARRKHNALLSAIRLYDALMDLMSDVERRFIALHYDERLSIARIADEHAQEVGAPHSANTLKRMNKAILMKVDQAVNS